MGHTNECDEAATDCSQDMERKELRAQTVALTCLNVKESLPLQSCLDGRNKGMRFIRRISRDQLKASSYSVTSNLSSSDSDSSSSANSSARLQHRKRRQYLKKMNEELKLKAESNSRSADMEGKFVTLNDLDNTDTISSLSDNERGELCMNFF